jgi:hypothetical protein
MSEYIDAVQIKGNRTLGRMQAEGSNNLVEEFLMAFGLQRVAAKCL